MRHHAAIGWERQVRVGGCLDVKEVREEVGYREMMPLQKKITIMSSIFVIWPLIDLIF